MDCVLDDMFANVSNCKGEAPAPDEHVWSHIWPFFFNKVIKELIF